MKRRTVDNWELGYLFGVPVVRGLVDGQRITAPWVWWVGWQRGHVGVSRGGRQAEEVLRLGRPSATAFAHLEGR